MPDTITAQSKAVIDRARIALQAAGVDARRLDALSVPLMVNELHDLALEMGCSAAVFLRIEPNGCTLGCTG